MYTKGTIRPRNDFLLIEPETPHREGGIEIPWDYFDIMITGTVKAIGPKVSQIKVGERVLMGRWAGIDFENNKKRVYLCQEREVDATVGEEVKILARPPGSTDISKPPVRSMMKKWDVPQVRSSQ